MTHWKEGIAYMGGSEAAEAEIIKGLGALVARQVQEIHAAAGGKPARPQHAKPLATTRSARFVVSASLPADLQVGFLVPGATYAAALRFSNAGALINSDRESDLRGMAAKVLVREGVAHDFLGTNAEIHHAKNAYEAMWASYCLYKPGAPAKIAGILRLMARVGVRSALRIVKTLSGQIKRPVLSLATETFWSRSPYRFGSVVGRFRMRAVLAPEPLAPAFEALGDELAARCQAGPVEYVLELQRYQDEARTPLEDSTVAWPTPHEEVGRFVLGQGTPLQDSDGAEPLSFSPWNLESAEFEALGNMNRARKWVYEASQKARAH